MLGFWKMERAEERENRSAIQLHPQEDSKLPIPRAEPCPLERRAFQWESGLFLGLQSA